jgi:hypothetical protein
MNLKVMLTAAFLTSVFLLVLSGVSHSHSWYPWECCSDRDCNQINDSDVKETQEGFTYLPSGEFIERQSVKFSQDEHFHLCRNQSTQRIVCFFIPDRGV